ncbi:MAG: DUF2490 domain-containing protein [Bacteroidales bacterium]|nr:DUF2490 domain-containing protein [Bacteroidales bacterium]
MHPAQQAGIQSESDFGAWYELNAEKSFSKKFDISGAFMVRTFDNASKIDQLFFELGASYSLNKYLGFAASYRIGNYVEDDYLYHVRNKWFTDIKGRFRQVILFFLPRQIPDSGKNIY